MYGQGGKHPRLLSHPAPEVAKNMEKELNAVNLRGSAESGPESKWNK